MDVYVGFSQIHLVSHVWSYDFYFGRQVLLLHVIHVPSCSQSDLSCTLELTSRTANFCGKRGRNRDIIAAIQS